MSYAVWIALAVLLAAPAGAARVDERTQLPPCSDDKAVPRPPGEVVRLFELHKDRNPENVLVIHTYADSRCRLIGSMRDKERLIDMYWRMNDGSAKACYKPTHPKIKSETLKSLKVTSLSPDKKTFTIDITQLDQLQHDLPSSEVVVALAPAGSGCRAEARLPLASSGGKVLRIQEIEAKGKYEMGVPRRGVKEIELKGVDSAKKHVRVVYRSK
jgi:hypothetical protein